MDTEMFRSSRSHWPGPSAVLLEELEDFSEELEEFEELEELDEFEEPEEFEEFPEEREPDCEDESEPFWESC